MTPDSKAAPTVTDTLFKRTVTIFTASSIAVMYGWLAGFEREPDGDFHFHWRWYGLLWAVIGYLSTAYFYYQVWPPEGYANAPRKSVVKGTIALVLPSLWWLTFPLRSDSGKHLWDVLGGLIVAATVLMFGAGMIFRLFKAFEKTDAYDLQNLDSEDKSPDPAPGKRG